MRRYSLLVEATGIPTCYLRKYKTSSVEQIIEFIKGTKPISLLCAVVNKLLDGCQVLYATGGGAYKYEAVLKKELNVEIKKVDEMRAVQLGLTFVLEKVKDSAFSFLSECKYLSGEIGDLWPLLVVNVGSGVSMIKVSGANSFERVSGSMIGGGTLMGLANMLIGINDFEELFELSKKGDNAKVDMMVRDLYGQTTSPYGLQADIISSSFGKAASGVGIKRRKSFFESPSKVTIDQTTDFRFVFARQTGT